MFSQNYLYRSQFQKQPYNEIRNKTSYIKNVNAYNFCNDFYIKYIFIHNV